MILVVSVRLLSTRESVARDQRHGRRRQGSPPGSGIFAAFAVLYGICETMNGNWAQVDMTSELGASTTEAALALTAFWGMVTVGRIGFAFPTPVDPGAVGVHVLPVPAQRGVRAHRAAPLRRTGPRYPRLRSGGLGCSALLPLTISFGQKDLIVMSAAVAGGVIAAYQLGYGIAAFGAGPLLDNGVGLRRSTGRRRPFAAAMGLLSFVVARGRQR
jgi:hypothetical protein